MGYKRGFEANEYEDLSLNKAKRFECSNELVSFADIVTPNKAFEKNIITGDDEDGFYNIQWYDPLETDTAKESLYMGDKNVQTSGHFSCYSEEDTGSGATSLSSASSGCSELEIPQKAFVPLDDDDLAFDCSPRKAVPIGPNHQANIPIWRATFQSRTNKEIVSYYFNVFMLRRRAAQNRSRFLDIDSDDDECHTRNAGIFGFENSDDSAIESLGDQDGRVENQDNYSDEDDEDDNSDDGTEDNVLGFTGCDVGNSSEIEGEIVQSSSNWKLNSQIETWRNPDEHVNGTSGILNYNMDDSCMSFECDANMDVSCHSHGLGDASPGLHARGFKCDQSPRMQGKLDLSSNAMEHVYLMEPCVTKDWYPGYSTCPTSTTDLDFLPTSNLIEEFFGHGTLDKKTRSD
uniref:ELM2 domain-containing protein n=1 Tax=Cajanus cajan TaxID=3821 RepID=A0A151UAR4_CAJCA|nr:hypothetical protein KK1_020658 [Cajanus cajan]